MQPGAETALGEPKSSPSAYGEVTEQVQASCSHSSAWQETRGIRCKLKQERFRLEIKSNFLTIRTAK